MQTNKVTDFSKDTKIYTSYYYNKNRYVYKIEKFQYDIDGTIIHIDNPNTELKKMKKTLMVNTFIDKDGFQTHEIIEDPNFSFTLGGLLTKIVLLIGVIILFEDLLFVLSSYGTWEIFLKKTLQIFVVSIAFIAFVQGKVGINTKWLNRSYSINLKKIIFNILLFISFIILIIIGWFLIKLFLENKENRLILLVGILVVSSLTLILYHLYRRNKAKAMHYAKDLWGGILIGLSFWALIGGMGYIKDTYKNYMYGTTDENEIICIENNKGSYIKHYELYEGKANYPYASIYACTEGKIKFDIDPPSPM